MITAIIPARSGSTRLPNKNVKLLAGKPLVFYTIEAFLNHNDIKTVLFSSDSQDYLTIVEREFGREVTLVYRPKATASDTAKVVLELERIIESMPDYFSGGWFAMGLPTAPLRGWNEVNKLLDYWRAKNKGCFSCHKYDFPAQFGFHMRSDLDGASNWEPLMGNASPMITGNTRSQDIEATYRPNGAIYINSVNAFLERNILYDQCDAVEISEYCSIDIDTEADFELAEYMLHKAKEKK